MGEHGGSPSLDGRAEARQDPGVPTPPDHMLPSGEHGHLSGVGGQGLWEVVPACQAPVGQEGLWEVMPACQARVPAARLQWTRRGSGRDSFLLLRWLS